MRTLLISLFLAVLVSAEAIGSGGGSGGSGGGGEGGGSGGGSGGGGAADSYGSVERVIYGTNWDRDLDYARAIAAIDKRDFPAAIDHLETYVARNVGDLHARYWLGFSYRRVGLTNAASANFERILAVDPKHQGAHGALGEISLLAGNTQRAEEHLKTLDVLCWLPCKEFAELKAAVVAYRLGRTPAPMR